MIEIYNESMELIDSPDLTLGWLEDSVRIEHHEAVKEKQEQGHYEEVCVYLNGGKDVEWIVDVPGVDAQDAWDEKIPIQIYHPYTQEQIDEIEKEKVNLTVEERIKNLEEAMKAIEEGIASV